MPSAKKSTRATVASGTSPSPSADEVIAELRSLATKKTRDGMARFAIPSDNAFGVTMSDMRGLAKRLGRNHSLAADLWESGWYEARMLATLIDDPAKVTPAQMDKWRRDFDNWAICDTACFALFDRTPHAFKKVRQWRTERSEFGKRGAFALLACLALHDKETDDEPFAEGLLFIEEASTDERNFVKKAVNWALRAIGGRSPPLRDAATDLARTLAGSENATARWIGKDALRAFAKKAEKRKK
jgi:3-methyladenine DNA glycosylase AlkD